jgi:hypothetical protein
LRLSQRTPRGTRHHDTGSAGVCRPSPTGGRARRSRVRSWFVQRSRGANAPARRRVWPCNDRENPRRRVDPAIWSRPRSWSNFWHAPHPPSRSSEQRDRRRPRARGGPPGGPGRRVLPHSRLPDRGRNPAPPGAVGRGDPARRGQRGPRGAPRHRQEHRRAGERVRPQPAPRPPRPAGRPGGAGGPLHHRARHRRGAGRAHPPRAPRGDARGARGRRPRRAPRTRARPRPAPRARDSTLAGGDPGEERAAACPPDALARGGKGRARGGCGACATGGRA